VSQEELRQKEYLKEEGLVGSPYGEFESFDLGATTLRTLVEVGLRFTVADTVAFPCSEWRPPARAAMAKPDTVYALRVGGELVPVAVAEWKTPTRLRTEKQKRSAAEQALWTALAMGVGLAIVTDGATYRYLDVPASVAAGDLVELAEGRDLTPAVLSDLHRGEAGVMRDPKPLAESVWQLIWHATKAEPKECLLTFVEIFMLKFLSDNLPYAVLPRDYRFDALLVAPDTFIAAKGMTQIEYYVDSIRPRIKAIFKEDGVVSDPVVRDVFGLDPIQSPTSIINGFAFLRAPGSSTGATYNRVFHEILVAFHNFGALTNIDPEFKLRLYETFLRKSARQQRLGQFFTPRNLVRPMIRMAQLNRLGEGAVVLDPAAGVGGFLLETLLFADALPGNVSFVDGRPSQRVRLVGTDVDVPTNILAKANMLLHLAESVRDPQTTPDAINQALVNTFVLLNENETLGALLQPPRDSVDVILTNPPYVTQGSSIYRKELERLAGPRNGEVLADYYDAGGLGVEALFLRYISGALKPGARAFVIVPLGLLNRTANRMKTNLLNECNVIGAIQLPRNSFFNTAQPTYILVLEKRRVATQSRPPVFCGIARSIGETLDYERVPTEDDNDLADLAELFVQYVNETQAQLAHPTTYRDSSIAKLVPSDAFGPDERWDVVRHWTDAEHVSLGQRIEAIDRGEFIDMATQTFEELVDELRQAKSDLTSLTAGTMADFELKDPSMFQVRSGVRIRNVDLREHPGDVPIYSVFTRPEVIKGSLDADWLWEAKGVRPERFPSVTVMATGASAVGMVHLREEGAVMTDDVVIVQPWPEVLLPGPFPAGVGPTPELPPHQIDLDYLSVALANTIAQGGYLYEAKLYVRRVRQLVIQVPVDEQGQPDPVRQSQIAAVAKRLDNVRARIDEANKWIRGARLA
jgi:type I restriction enzyme M protein